MTTKEVNCERKKVKVVMHEYKEGSLKRRNSKPVKSRKEAVAIALNVLCEIQNIYCNIYFETSLTVLGYYNNPNVARRKCSRKKSKKSRK